MENAEVVGSNYTFDMDNFVSKKYGISFIAYVKLLIIHAFLFIVIQGVCGIIVDFYHGLRGLMVFIGEILAVLYTTQDFFPIYYMLTESQLITDLQNLVEFSSKIYTTDTSLYQQ